MQNIIIGLPKKEQCESVKEIFISNGYFNVNMVNTAADILNLAGMGGGGIVVCSLKLPDMTALRLKEILPAHYSMLVLLSGSQVRFDFGGDIFSLSLPVNKADLIKTINMIFELTAPSGKAYNGEDRTLEDKYIIGRAKLYLMNKYKISEGAAHRFIQKNSMDKGLKMVETAKIILRD